MGTDRERNLMRLLRGCKDSERREMCVAGIQMFILTEDDINYIIDTRNHIADVRAYYHKKIMEM